MPNKKRFSVKSALLLLFILIIAWTSYIQWKIHSVSEKPITSKADTAIVLGAALWSNVPSPALKERLDHTVQLYHKKLFTSIIVSGGLDHNESTITEAEGMKRYLVQKGIPGSAVITENEARSTYENLLFSKRLMDDRGWKHAIIVTHTYHGPRALDMATHIGYDRPAVSVTDSRVMWMPYHNARESLAYTKWQLQKLWMNPGNNNASTSHKVR